MKVKTRIIPHIEILGDYWKIVYKEETVIEETFFKRLLQAFMKSHSWIYFLGLFLNIGICFIGNSSKWIYAMNFLWIGVYITLIFIETEKEFKK